METNSRKCPKCGAYIPHGERYCVACGADTLTWKPNTTIGDGGKIDINSLFGARVKDAKIENLTRYGVFAPGERVVIGLSISALLEIGIDGGGEEST